MALLRFPRPRTFLHLISLRTATEFITFTLALNKITGLYGILALFTGYHLNPLQLSHYIYSLLVLALIIYLSPAIRAPRDAPVGSTIKILGLAWLYVLDTVVNSVYTTLFGLGWFVLLAQHLGEKNPVPGAEGIVGGIMNDTAGFTSPEHTVSQVDVVAIPAAPGAVSGQEATIVASGGSLSGVVLEQGSLSSIFIIALLWLVRLYFCIVILSYARSTLRAHIAASSAATGTYTSTSSTDPNIADSPFRRGRTEGEGWFGALGRTMLKFPSTRYWLGKDESEDEWARSVESRVERARGLRIKVPGGNGNGVGERERRARSGTGPPVPLGPMGVGKGKVEQ
ncbi:hypothetical protein LTR78_010573 [Recurvomyces mirabilis]|uniref:DUF1753-domain-containing protein n=1 Tax=Recurvomyces mirabilis TaxID=574656 RepID=A0AAE0TQ94_9PEZI|nr:hypothetical protein LTR78_010573 [Recurvomyces mirabilis]KAK5160783.1 hypothetical protein LTS14_001796 [Recurvomyces mirabilis]